MEPTVQSVERRELSAAPSPLLKIPPLKQQRSLQELIGDELGSLHDGPIEMPDWLVPRDENNVDGVAIDATSSETCDGVNTSSAQPTTANKSEQETNMTDTCECAGVSQGNLWKRLFRRTLSKSEEPKVVYSEKRHKILREVLCFHLLPVAVNFTLLGLYIRQVLWTPPWPTTNVLNALQFAAKIHEALMIASLAKVLLHHIRYRLLSSGSHGLQLGLVTSPFRLLDITYLWSGEFRAAWSSLRKFYISEGITIIIHVFLFTLAAVLGPASAISMLPREGEWELARRITDAPFYTTHDRNNIYQVYIGAETTKIFPKVITAEFTSEACDYNDFTLPQTNLCPRLGLGDILRGIFPPEIGSSDFLLPTSEYWIPWVSDITIRERNRPLLPPRKIKVNQYPIKYNPDTNYQSLAAIVDVTTAADTIMYLAAMLIEYYVDCWTMTLGADTAMSFREKGQWPAYFDSYPGQGQSKEIQSSWKYPSVSSFCSTPVADASVAGSVTFDLVQTLSTPLYRVTLDVKLLVSALNDRSIAFINSSDLNITPSYTPSTAYVFTSETYTTLCLVKVNWIDSYLSGYPSESFARYFGDVEWSSTSWTPNTGFDVLQEKAGWFNEASAADMVHLDLDWLAILDRGTGNDDEGRNSFFDKVRRICLGALALGDDDSDHAGRHPNAVCMASGFGAGIAEGLSKVPYKPDIYALGSIEDATDGQPGRALTLSPWTFSGSSDAGIYNWDRPPKLLGNWTTSALTPSEILANSTRFDFVLRQTRHGYSFSGVTITLSFVVLFLYVATVFVHISLVVFGTGWSSRAWSTLGQFFVLALNSPAPTSVLDNTGAGVKTSETWRARVSVQDLQHERRVGMAVADPGRSDAENGSSSKVQPDQEYS